MAIPLQVVKMGQEADRLYDELYGSKQDEDQPNTNDEGNVEVKDEQDAGKGDSQVPVTDSDASGSTDGVQDQPDKPDDDTKRQEQPSQSSDDFKHKYEVLRGMYNKDVQDLRYQLGLLQGKLQEYEKRIQDIPKEPGQKQQDIAQAVLADIESDPDVGFLKTEAPYIWKALEKITSKVVRVTNDEVSRVASKIDEQSAKVTRSEEERFYDKLDTTIPDWEEINKSPEFIQWLSEVERYTGVSRHALLEDAYKRKDANRVVAFFEDFKTLNNKETQQKGAIPDNKVPKDVAPPKSAGTRKPLPGKESKQDFEVIKSSDIQQFYSDVRRGKYEGRDEEKRKIEAKIERALVEGRII